MKRCVVAAVLILLSVLVQAGPMSTAGQFEVSPTGAATYAIPIQVPPGTAGIEPKLSLVYNSQSGNGLLGVGWSLLGLSAITRCPRTMAQDGVRGGVNYGVNDRFCFDGQRLMATNGTYGADGTEYRTERESFTKIVSYGSVGNGPAWFKVWTKAGQIIEYGNTADSRIEAQGKTSVRAWAMNKLSDTKSNYLTAVYTENGTSGEFYPQRIDYTANGSGSQPSASVQFEYQARPDVTTIFFGGAPIRPQVRISRIAAYIGTSEIKEYRLAYSSSASTARSRLSSLTECAGDGTCLPQVSFTWEEGGGGMTVGNNAVQTVSGDWKDSFPRILTGDFNGDGVADLYLIGSSATYFCPGPSVSVSNIGSCVLSATGDWNSAFPKILVGDFNGDGISDLFLVGYGASYFCPGPNVTSSSTWSCAQVVTGDWVTNFPRMLVGDFDGNGVSDLYLIGSSATYFCPGPGISQSNSGCVQSASGDWNTAFPRVIQGDFNGDGIVDLFLVGSGNSYFCPGPANNKLATWSCNVAAVGDLNTSFPQIIPGDFNGDGIADLVLVGSGASYFCPGPQLTLSSTWSCAQIVAGDWTTTNFAIYAGDYNGDGITDLHLVGSSASYTCLGPGISVAANCVQTAIGNRRAAFSIYPGDFNGDGTTDLFLVGSGASYFDRGGLGPPDLMKKIEGAAGGIATVAYRPLTNSATYTKGVGAAYPVQDLQAPRYVVSQAQSANDVSGTLTTNYTYGGLKADAGTGRGLLGFGWTQATSADTGIAIKTTYRQDWPYIGLPSMIKKTVASGGNAGLLSQTSYTYGCLNPQLGSACTMAAGNRYFPYVSQSVESGYDLSGTALPSVTTTNQFDAYGNATQVTVTSSDGTSKTTTNSYTNDTTNWTLGRLQRSQVQSVTP